MTEKKVQNLGLTAESYKKIKTSNQQLLRNKLKLELRYEVNLRFETQIWKQGPDLIWKAELQVYSKKSSNMALQNIMLLRREHLKQRMEPWNFPTLLSINLFTSSEPPKYLNSNCPNLCFYFCLISNWFCDKQFEALRTEY